MTMLAKISFEDWQGLNRWEEPNYWGEEELHEENGVLTLKGWHDADFLMGVEKWEYKPTKDELVHWLMNNDFRNLFFVKGRKRAKTKAEKMIPNWKKYMNWFDEAVDHEERFIMRDYFQK